MRASLQNIVKALHARTPPAHVWQQPFLPGGCNFKRLCKFTGKGEKGGDLLDYLHVLSFGQSPLQPDLFRYLLPIILEVWRKDLLSDGGSGYAGLVEYIWGALANRPLLQDNLTPRERVAVE